MPPPVPSKESRCVQVAKSECGFAGLLFGFGLFLPTSPTVPWPLFLSIYGTMFIAALVSFVCFLVSRRRGHSVRISYGIVSVLFIIAFFIVTLAPIYRLRWHLIFE